MYSFKSTVWICPVVDRFYWRVLRLLSSFTALCCKIHNVLVQTCHQKRLLATSFIWFTPDCMTLAPVSVKTSCKLPGWDNSGYPEQTSISAFMWIPIYGTSFHSSAMANDAGYAKVKQCILNTWLACSCRGISLLTNGETLQASGNISGQLCGPSPSKSRVMNSN